MMKTCEKKCFKENKTEIDEVTKGCLFSCMSKYYEASYLLADLFSPSKDTAHIS